MAGEGSRGEAVRPRVLAAVVLLGVMVLVTLIGVSTFAPPTPIDEGPEGFNTSRALEHLRVIAAEPHPAGTVQGRRVARYLQDQLDQLGLEARIDRESLRGIELWNVLARIPGTGDDAVLLAAHHDSVTGAPGAGDNGAAVAALLETARALAADPPPRNDMILFFPDGEELGFLGAQAFVSNHPWASDVGFVVNFDARGSGGRLMLGESTRATRRLGDVFASAGPRPYGTGMGETSIAQAITGRSFLPTDFHIFAQHGIPGLNFVFLGETDNYHTPQDSVANLDLGSLYHVGSTALDLARDLGARDLRDPSGGAAVFFTVGPVLVTYPQTFAWVVAAVAAALATAALVLGVRRRVGLRGVAAGVATALGSCALALPTGILLLRAIERAHGVRFPALFPPPGGFGSQGWHLLGIAFVVVGLTALLLTWTTRRFGLESVVAGVLLLGIVLTVLATAAATGLSFAIAFPTAIAGAGAFTWWSPRTGQVGSKASLTVLTVWAATVLALTVPVMTFGFRGVLLAAAPAFAVPFALLTALLWPQLEALSPGRGWAVPVAAMVVALAFFTVGTVTA